MDKRKNEFLGLLCNFYIIVLMAAVPLYTGEGYWKLGDTKYVLFRNVSILVLGCWLVLGMPGRIGVVTERIRWLKNGRIPAKLPPAFGPVDCAVAAYGVFVLLSALCSEYQPIAWNGYNEWYMGAISQLIFVGIYFFVSRQYNGALYPLYLGEAAFFLVTLLGLLHRLGIDPLGLQRGWNSGDWEYNHMLSTLGNINWLCGYYSVALAFVLAHFFREKRFWLQTGLCVSAVAAFVLLGIQGSQGGLLILAVGAALSLILGWGDMQAMRKLFLLLGGFFLCMPIMDLLTRLRGKKAAVAADGNIFDHTVWYGWVIAAAVCAVLFGISILWKRSEYGEKGAGMKLPSGKDILGGRRKVLAAGMLLGGVGAALAVYLMFHGMDDGFGSGRGFLWRIAGEGFFQANVKDKLLGAGPDCYGIAVFNRLGADTEVWKGEHWEGAIFTNAHNEILSQLINVGIMGMLCYAAIFLTGLWAYGSMFTWAQQKGNGKRQERIRFLGWLGVLAIVMYGAHSLISFQQVLNTPLLFMTLGLCECGLRSKQKSLP
jgi:O-antigen ligase